MSSLKEDERLFPKLPWNSLEEKKRRKLVLNPIRTPFGLIQFLIKSRSLITGENVGDLGANLCEVLSMSSVVS